ncbi:MAG: IS1595 family transposase [Luteolibacter sp.]
MNAAELALPETLQQAIVYFGTGDNAFNFVKDLRWPDGKPKCPRCQCDRSGFISTRKVWECKGCKKQFTVKLGTIFEDSPIKLDKWMAAIWLIANAKNGVSSYEIHRSLGVTQKTGWFMMHRIRLALKYR